MSYKGPSGDHDPFERMTAWSGGGESPDSGERTQTLEVILGQVVSAGGSASGTARFRVVNPSARLRVKVAVTFIADQAVWSPPSITDSVVTLTPWVYDKNGAEAPADANVTAEALPYVFEGETSADTFRGDVTLAQQTSLTGYFKAVVTWEAPEEMTTARFAALKGRCGVSAVTPRLSITAGGSP